MNEKIKNLRLSVKLTQENFAKSLDVSRGVIAQIETGKNAPTTEILSKIKNKYGVDLFGDSTITDSFQISRKDKLFIEEQYFDFSEVKFFYSKTLKEIKDSTSIYKEQIRARVKSLNYISEIATAKVSDESYRYEKLTFNIDDNERIEKTIKDYDLETFKFDDNKIKFLLIMLAMKECSENLSSAIDYALFHLKNALIKSPKITPNI